MVSEIREGIFRIEVPLPIPVVGSVNCYVLKDADRHLIIDPGMSHDMCYQAVAAGIDEIGVDPERSDFLVTHHHVDHFGLVGRIMGKRSAVYASRVEAEIAEMIGSRSVLPILTDMLHAMGFPEDNPEAVLPELFGPGYQGLDSWSFCHVDDGAIVTKGGRTFRCMLTPGHSPGHICLYETESGLLITGDVLSPVLQFFSRNDNPLRSQFRTLVRLGLLDAPIVLPGHRGVFGGSGGIAQQFEAHHRARNSAIVEVLSDQSMDAYRLAETLAPGTQAGKWNELPVILRFFAARDCLAHLLYLESEGRVRKERFVRKLIFYS
jgi:glyoxylase-like metal-dependent hydrolase (beta-lactamase superfamily II)